VALSTPIPTPNLTASTYVYRCAVGLLMACRAQVSSVLCSHQCAGISHGRCRKGNLYSLQSGRMFLVALCTALCFPLSLESHECTISICMQKANELAL
jgi:hypothetical protein